MHLFLPLLLFGRQGNGVYNLYLLDKKKLTFGQELHTVRKPHESKHLLSLTKNQDIPGL